MTAMPALSAGMADPEPGAFYGVTGVSVGDRLNVRDHPGVQGNVVGSLAPDTQQIVVTGVREDVGSSVWWEIVFAHEGGRTGWVSARFLAPDQSSPRQEAGYPVQCVGTEPFWSLDIADGEAHFSLAGDPGQDLIADAWKGARGLSGQFAVRLGDQAGRHGYAVLVRQRDYCSDGMSDRLFPYTGTVILPNGDVFGGCCKRLG